MRRRWGRAAHRGTVALLAASTLFGCARAEAPPVEVWQPVRLTALAGLDGGVSDLEAAPNGSFIGADHGARTVLQWSPSGLLQWTTGGQGDGPGEFQLAYRVAPCDDGRTWVGDLLARRLTRLAPDGSVELARPIALPILSMDDLLCTADGGVLLAGVVGGSGTGGNLLHLFAPDGSHIRSFGARREVHRAEQLALWGAGTVFRAGGDMVVFARWVPLQLEYYRLDGSLTRTQPISGAQVPSLDSLVRMETDRQGNVQSLGVAPGASEVVRITGWSALTKDRSLLSLTRGETTELAVVDAAGRIVRRAALVRGSFDHLRVDPVTREVTTGIETEKGTVALAVYRLSRAW